MRTQIKILAVLLICFVPQSGCKVIKKTFSRKFFKTETSRTVDSISVHRLNSDTRLTQGSTESYEELLKKYQKAFKEQKSDVNFRRETVLRPVTVPGKTYEFTANWVLDTAATGGGVITYFAADQPDLSASISKDSAGRMKVKIQTKDKVIDMPVESVAFSSRQAIRSDSSQYQDDLKRAMSEDSLSQSATVAGHDSVHQKSDLQQKTREKVVDKSSRTIDTRSVWLLVTGVAVFALLVIAWRFGWIGKIFAWFKK